MRVRGPGQAQKQRERARARERESTWHSSTQQRAMFTGVRDEHADLVCQPNFEGNHHWPCYISHQRRFWFVEQTRER